MKKFRFLALALLLLGTSCGSYLKPDGTFEIKTKAQLMGIENTDPEYGVLVDSPKVTVYYAPLDDSKTRGELNQNQRVSILGHVVRGGETQDWMLIGADGMEGYVRTPNVDPIIREGVEVALLPVDGAGEPLFAKALLERHYQLADGTLVTREGVADLEMPTALQDDAKAVVVEGDEAFTKLFDSESRVAVAAGTPAVLLGLVRYVDERAALTPYQSPALVRTGDGKVVFVPLNALLVHTVDMAEGTVGVRPIVRFNPDDPYQGHYSRLECWKNGAVVFQGPTQPGDIESIQKAENNPGAEWVMVRRFTAPTLGGGYQYDEPLAEAVVEDWYHRDAEDKEPWGQSVFRLNRSLRFSVWNGDTEETHKLSLSGLGERLSGKKSELQGSYELSTWKLDPPAEPEYHEGEGESSGEGEDISEQDYGDPGPPSGRIDVEGSLSFGVTASYDDGFALDPQGSISDVNLPEEWRTSSVEGLYSMISSALARAVDNADVAEELFPTWYH